MSRQAKNEQIKLYAVIGLAIVAAVLAWFRFGGRLRASAPPTGEVAMADSFLIPDLPPWIDSLSESVAAASYAPPARDIFVRVPEAIPEKRAPVEDPDEPSGPPRLGGIMQGARERLAVIDGKIVRVGDRVGAYTVREISRLGVVLTSAEGRLTLGAIE